jgi:hypothetical protein
MVEMPRITAHMEVSEAQELSRAFEKLGVKSGVLDFCVSQKKTPESFSESEAAARALILLSDKQEVAAVDEVERLCASLGTLGTFDAGRAAEIYCALAKLEGWRSAYVGISMQALMQRALSRDI